MGGMGLDVVRMFRLGVMRGGRGVSVSILGVLLGLCLRALGVGDRVHPREHYVGAEAALGEEVERVEAAGDARGRGGGGECVEQRRGGERDGRFEEGGHDGRGAGGGRGVRRGLPLLSSSTKTNQQWSSPSCKSQ